MILNRGRSMSNKTEARDIAALDFKLFYRCIVTETTYYGLKTGTETDGLESNTESNPHSYIHRIFMKGANNKQVLSPSANGALKSGYLHERGCY